MNKFFWAFIGFVSVALIVFIPFAVGYIAQSKNQSATEDASAWIGFFGNYFGAIIGGLIGAGVTLLGIKWSLGAERKRAEEQRLHELEMQKRKKEEEREGEIREIRKHFIPCHTALRKSIGGMKAATYPDPNEHTKFKVEYFVKEAVEVLKNALDTYSKPLEKLDPFLHMMLFETYDHFNTMSDNILFFTKHESDIGGKVYPRIVELTEWLEGRKNKLEDYTVSEGVYTKVFYLFIQ